MVLALCVLVHLVTILYAIKSGLSASAILSRTQGNAAFAAFYGLFVVAVAIHAPIGLARVVEEWLGWRGRSLGIVMLALAALLTAMGARAVWGLYGG